MVKNLDAWGREKARKRFQDGGGVAPRQSVADMMRLPANHPTFNESRDTAPNYGGNYPTPPSFDAGPKSRRSPKLKGHPKEDLGDG